MMCPSKTVWMVLNSKRESGGTKHCKINDFQTIYCIQFMIQQTVINAVWQKILANGRKYNTESELYVHAVTFSLCSLL